MALGTLSSQYFCFRAFSSSFILASYNVRRQCFKFVKSVLSDPIGPHNLIMASSYDVFQERQRRGDDQMLAPCEAHT